MFRSLWDKLRGKQPEPEPTAGPTTRESFDSAIPHQTPEEQEHEEQREQSERDRPDGPDYDVSP